MQIIIEFISGENVGTRKKFSGDSVLVGRSENCDLVLSSDVVSYQHGRINIKGDGLFLTDLGSSNGTFVNDSPHDKGYIAFGDLVRFGEGGPEVKITYTDESAKVDKRAKTEMVKRADTVLILEVAGDKTYRFPPGKIIVGREVDCDLPLDHLMVSRAHAEIDFQPPNLKIRDLNSTNGTFINGKKIDSSRLSVGDEIVFGDNGPEVIVDLGGDGAGSVKKSGRKLGFIAVIVIIALALAGGYFALYRPYSEKQEVEKKSLNEYVAWRLKDLSAQMGDPQDEIPLIFVESVAGYVEKFTGNLRNWFSRSMKRAHPQLGMVRRLLRGAGLPEHFAWLAFVESGYDTTVTSHAGARGLWQFMPATARQFGLRVDGNIDERIYPKKSTQAACKYIKQLYNLYNSYMLAMASYNTGEGRVARALRRIDVIGENRFWYLVKSDMLHNETMEYVPKIMAVMIIATDPERFGFENEDSDR